MLIGNCGSKADLLGAVITLVANRIGARRCDGSHWSGDWSSSHSCKTQLLLRLLHSWWFVRRQLNVHPVDIAAVLDKSLAAVEVSVAGRAEFVLGVLDVRLGRVGQRRAAAHCVPKAVVDLWIMSRLSERKEVVFHF